MNTVDSLENWLGLCAEFSEDCDGTPSEWAARMRVAWSQGARRFGKIPAAVPTISAADEGPTGPRTEITGPVRSLKDPECPPLGSRFFIAWEIAGKWHHRIPPFIVCGAIGRSLSEMLHKSDMLISEDEKTKHHALLNSALESLPRASKVLRGIDQARELASEGKLEEAIAQAFAAGRDFGQRECLSEMEPILKLHYARDKSTELNEMVYEAMNRHGDSLPPFKLLEIMGGKRVQETVPEDGGPTNKDEDYWAFPSGAKVDSMKFQKAHKQAKARRAQEQSQPSQPD